MASNIFKVLALIQLLQCAYPLENGYYDKVDDELCAYIPSEVDIETTLYTSFASKVITADESSLKAAPFTGNKKLVFIIPGYYIDSKSVEVVALKNAYLKAYPQVNVIVVDISVVLKATGNYVGAVNNGVPYINNKMVKFIKTLLKIRVEIKDVSIVGIEYGAQCAGKIGGSLKRDGIVLSKVTALSPMGPLFPVSYVSVDVAITVEVYHSNVGKLGYDGIIGTYDIFLEYGKHQTNCPTATYPNKDQCSQASAVWFYIQIVNGKTYKGKKCLELVPRIPYPITECQKAVNSFGYLDVEVQTSVCEAGYGDSVTIKLDADLSGAYYVGDTDLGITIG